MANINVTYKGEFNYRVKLVENVAKFKFSDGILLLLNSNRGVLFAVNTKELVAIEKVNT